jgi:Protein of unknown function (DUF3043)
MRVFRRNSAGAQDGTAQDRQGAKGLGTPDTKTADRPAAEATKGRPTPKRSEAERGRKQGITGGPPRSQSGRGGSARGGGASRTDTKADRARRYEAMKRGEDWALQPRDRGPVKALARDYIDSRRRISEFYMYVMVALIILLFIRNPAVQKWAEPIALLLILFVLVDAWFIRRSLRKLVAERLPGESARGATMYTVFRALQIRKMRMPAPRVRPGDKF